MHFACFPSLCGNSDRQQTDCGSIQMQEPASAAFQGILFAMGPMDRQNRNARTSSDVEGAGCAAEATIRSE